MGLEVLYLLIPASALLALIALALFIWAIHTGQFDDLETPAIRILFDDGTNPANTLKPNSDVSTSHDDSPAHSPVTREA